MISASQIDFDEQPVSLNGLKGTWLASAQCGALPPVLFHSGSGPTNRNGSGLQANNHCLQKLAHALSQKGIASLRFDKRGVGDSYDAALCEADLRFETYVDDLCAFSRFVQQKSGNLPVLLGHSEGALVATLAASRVPISGLVVLAGMGRTMAKVLEDQLQALLQPSLLEEALRILKTLTLHQSVPNVSPELTALFRPSVQPYLISCLSLDPAENLSQVKAPCLIIHGTHDLQVNAEDAARLHAAKPDATLYNAQGMNHILVQAPRERRGNSATYARDDLPLFAGLDNVIAGFLHEL